MLPLGLIGGGLLGAGEIAYGLINQSKARKAAAANIRPKYEIPDEERQAENLAQAESMAGQGMSAASRQQLYQNTANMQGQSIDAILRAGGDPNAISNLANNTQNQLNQSSIYDNQARLQNLGNLQALRSQISSRRSASKDKAWQLNHYQPWADRAQAIAQQSQGAQNMINSGVNQLGMGLVSGLGSLSKPAGIPSQPQGMPPSPWQMPMQPQADYSQGNNFYPTQPFGMMADNNTEQGGPSWNGWSFQ